MSVRQALIVGTALLATFVMPAAPLAQDSDAPAPTAGDAAEPIPVDLVETEEVRLIVLDVLVLDSKDRTVPGLTLDDFEIVSRGKPVPPDTLDVNCDQALGDARAVNHAKNRELALPPGAGGKVVLAFDYLHLQQIQRAEVLDHAKEMIQYGGVEGEEVMLAALNGGLRIEQTFSGDHEEVYDSLDRMQHDITLWQPSFLHTNEIGWVAAMTTLFDVLGTVPGPKKVVFFSAMRDVPLDLQFREIASQAAVSRCSIYPVDAGGLTTIDMGGIAARSGAG